MSHIAEYLLFFAETLTLVVAILIVIAGIVAIMSKAKQQRKGQLIIKSLNERYDDMREQLNAKLLSKKELKAFAKTQKKLANEKTKKSEAATQKKLFVLKFTGDLKASAVTALREEITAILTVAKPEDEVIVKLESPGGMVAAYGLAASQLQRIREKGIQLTVIVDMVAASGGYLMACVANKIYAAPFAYIGSIGVVAQLPNFHRLLKKNDIDYEQITAGEFKRTLTIFGENTEQGRKKFKEEVEDIHQLFKQHILQYRTQLDINQVATGEYWTGARALELNLIDGITTSDDYLMEASRDKALFEVKFTMPKTIGQKIAGNAQLVLDRLMSNNVGLM